MSERTVFGERLRPSQTDVCTVVVDLPNIRGFLEGLRFEAVSDDLEEACLLLQGDEVARFERADVTADDALSRFVDEALPLHLARDSAKQLAFRFSGSGDRVVLPDVVTTTRPAASHGRWVEVGVWRRGRGRPGAETRLDDDGACWTRNALRFALAMCGLAEPPPRWPELVLDADPVRLAGHVVVAQSLASPG